MEGVEENFRDIEWTIENFTCWNNEFHGMSLEVYDLNVSLFPRAFCDSDEERVIVTILDCRASSVYLTFFHPKGTILYKTEISNPESKPECMNFDGPKFTEITKKMKALQTDTLIIRCRLYGVRLCGLNQILSIIEVSDMCFKVQSKEEDLDLLCWKNKRVSGRFYPNNGTFGVFTLQSSQESSDSGEKSLAFTLGLITDNPVKYLIRTYLSVLNCCGKTIYSEENECMFKDKQCWTFSSIHLQDLEVKRGFATVIKLRCVSLKKPTHLYNFFTNKNHSTLLVGRNADEKLLKNTIFIDPENSVTLLSKDLECLYEGQDFSDFEICCANTTFATHKAILSARSPVFKTMLSSGMREAASNSMEISDMDVHTLGRFLSFLYTGTVKELEWESAMKLYHAADKYEIPSLKKECSNILVASVCVSNVCEILLLGSRHQDDEITFVAQDFIAKNYDAVLRSEEWELFMEKDSYLLIKTLTTISKKGSDKI